MLLICNRLSSLQEMKSGLRRRRFISFSSIGRHSQRGHQATQEAHCQYIIPMKMPALDRRDSPACLGDDPCKSPLKSRAILNQCLAGQGLIVQGFIVDYFIVLLPPHLFLIAFSAYLLIHSFILNLNILGDIIIIIIL